MSAPWSTSTSAGGPRSRGSTSTSTPSARRRTRCSPCPRWCAAAPHRSGASLATSRTAPRCSPRSTCRCSTSPNGHTGAMPRRRPSWPTGSWSPEPPRALPPGSVVHLPGRGETFVRDTEGNGPVLLLLHGWMVSADLNWFTAYDALAEAGFRVLALDHRGHGRGVRPLAPFRLTDCADDAAALLDHLGIERAFVAGYSMGGPVAQLLARARPDLVAGLVLCATSRNWRHPRVRVIWQTMAGLRLLLGVAPEAAWRRGLRSVGFPDAPVTAWFAAELTRGRARGAAAAGREPGRRGPLRR